MRDRLRRTRVRLTLVYLGALAAVAGVAAIASWFAFASYEYGTVDASLDAQAQIVVSALADSSGEMSLSGEQLPGQTVGGIAVAALLVTPDGRVIDRSGQVPDPKALAAVVRGSGAVFAPSAETRVVAGHPQRILLRRVRLASGQDGVLLLARPVDELQQTLRTVAILLTVVVGGLVVGGGTLGYWLAGRALRPVRLMSATAREISEHDLHRRLQLDLVPGDELSELAATFNAMLARLEAAFEGLQRFTADAAHEFRVPLALMRTQVDVTLRRERSAGQYRESHLALLAEIQRLSRMAEHLLLLARADAGALPLRRDELEVRELLEEIIERWRPAAREKGLRIDSDLPAEGLVRGDPDLLRRLFDNLIDNALRSTPQGGRVRVRARLEDGGWQIAVRDSGPGVSIELRGLLFTRFARGDAARGRDGGGSGLGLSLCAAIARAHGGAISLEEPADHAGACFLVQLPAAGVEGKLTLPE
jgi:heavy metal sensor kinase